MIREGEIAIERDTDLSEARSIQDRYAFEDLRRMEEGAITSRTVKLTVGGVDVYAHVGYVEGRAVHVRVDGFREDDNRQRAPLELLCEVLSDELRRGLLDLDAILATWRGTRFPPEGPCPQLQGANAHSPLDAIGWYFSGVKRGS